jgi:hypothetical protein
MSEDTIRVITYEPIASVGKNSYTGEKVGNSKRIDYFGDDDNDNLPIKSGQVLDSYIVKPNDVSVETLEKEMTNLQDVVNIFFEQSQEQESNNKKMVLDEIELVVEISGEGKIGILGNGVKVGTKGGIKLKYKRQS